MEKIRKAFINYSQTFDDVYQNLEDCNLTEKVLMVYDYTIRDMYAH